LRAGIPAIIGTAGPCWAADHIWSGRSILFVNWARREGIGTLKFASIDSEIEPAILADAFRRGEIKPLSPAPLFQTKK